MIELFLEVLGWLAFLERPAVVLQLALSLAVLVLSRQARKRRWLGRVPTLAYPHLGQALLALVCLVLAAFNQPFGLAELLAALWFGWSCLGLLQRLLERWLPKEAVHRLGTRLLRPLYLVMAVLLIVSEFESLRDLEVIPLGQMFGVTVTTEQAFQALLVIYLVMVGCGPPASGVAWLLQRTLGMSEGSRKASELMLRYMVVGLGLVGVAVYLGLNTTALIAVAGGLSVGLGFGVKEVFSNFVSGLWLLVEGSVRPGEVLMLDGDPCEVRQLGLRATLLWRARDNAELLIPNQTFFTQAATSFTASDRMRRSQVNVGAAYHHDPAVVIELLEATAREVAGVLQEPPPKALLMSYGDFAIDYALRFWIANPMENGGICSNVNQAIWHAFKRHQIEIPFPQQVQYELPWPAQEPEAGRD